MVFTAFRTRNDLFRQRNALLSSRIKAFLTRNAAFLARHFLVQACLLARMKVVLNLKSLSELQLITFASTIITRLTGNATFTPKPTLSALGSLRDAAQAAIAAAAAARQAAILTGTQKDQALAALRDGITAEAATVQSAVDALPEAQQEAAVESAGMIVQAAPKRLTELPGIAGLSLTVGDQPGEIDWQCEPVARASFYLVEYTTDPLSPAAKWVSGTPSTKSSGAITGLTPGGSVSVRVRAAGTHDVTGAPAVAGPKIVP